MDLAQGGERGDVLDQPALGQEVGAFAVEGRRRGGDPDAESGVCRAGTIGAEFVGPIPLRGEPIVFKTRYSGFHDANLDAVLKGLGVDTIVVCGLTTECCVDCTVRDAFHRDYHVFVAADACAAYDPALHAGALRSLEINCAILAGTAGIVDVWTEAASHG